MDEEYSDTSSETVDTPTEIEDTPVENEDTSDVDSFEEDTGGDESFGEPQDVVEDIPEGFQEETEPTESASDIIPEDTQNYDFEGASDADKAEAEKFMEENPDLFSNLDDTTSLNEDNDVETYHNKDSEAITLGKYEADEDGNELPTSYQQQAENNDTAYFSNEDYNKIQQEGDFNADEMYEQSGNKDVVENALAEGKDIQFSHDPRDAGGGFGREWETIQNQTGSSEEDLTVGEDGRLRLNDYTSYSTDYNEQPPHNPEDYD